MSGKAGKLLDAIGMASDAHVMEAHGGEEGAEATERPQARRTSWRRRAAAVAACLTVAVGVGAFALANFAPTVDAGSSSTDALEADVAVEEADGAAVEAYSLGTSDGAVAFEKMSADGLATAADAASPLAAGSIAAGQGDFGEEVEAGLLTAAEWNDNANWPFFANLVNAGTVSFPSFGIDPRHRVKAVVTDAAGNALRGERVVLRAADGSELWHATSGADGAAYLFYREGEAPASVAVPAAGAEQPVSAARPAQQGSGLAQPSDEVALVLPGPSAVQAAGKQVMFIVDTTGSMSDEIAYLQADFSAIAADVGADGVTYSANFYRDEGEDEEYVTKCNPFTGDVATVQRQLNDEYADGGGDEPEAVAQVLAETITDNASWRDDAAKIAFLVFDAPPHEGTDAALDAAVRSAAARGIRIVPVVASNASRDTELFGRALAICTGATYVFLTDDSGVGDAHLEPIVGDYEVEPLHDIIVRLIREA